MRFVTSATSFHSDIFINIFYYAYYYLRKIINITHIFSKKCGIGKK